MWMVDVYMYLITFINQLLYHVFGVDINHYQSPESHSSLFGKLASHQCHNVGQLVLQLLVVVLHSLWAVPNGLVDLLCPVDLVDTDGHLPRPLSHPVNPFGHWVGLGGGEGGERTGRKGESADKECVSDMFSIKAYSHTINYNVRNSK